MCHGDMKEVIISASCTASEPVFFFLAGDWECYPHDPSVWHVSHWFLFVSNVYHPQPQHFFNSAWSCCRMCQVLLFWIFTGDDGVDSSVCMFTDVYDCLGAVRCWSLWRDFRSCAFHLHLLLMKLSFCHFSVTVVMGDITARVKNIVVFYLFKESTMQNTASDVPDHLLREIPL